MKERHSAKFLRQRKMMMVLPLLTIPFLTMAFWALGGGQVSESKNSENNKTGLNLQLPDANLKDDKNEDKLSFYKEADADSLKREEILHNDPYYKDSISDKQNTFMPSTENIYNPLPPNTNLNSSPYNTGTDANEQKIYQKINELNKQINQPDISSASYNKQDQPVQASENNEQFSKQVDRLQEMMQQMNNKAEVNPEMQQLNGTLDKILDIQNPGTLKENLKEKSLLQKQVAFSVSKHSNDDNVSLLDTTNKTIATGTGFYGIDDNVTKEEENSAIEAVVHESQTLVNGAVIKLRLLADIYINGNLIPKDNFIFGTASLNDERLEVEINSIRNNKSLFPVKLEVYDLDGLPGIYIPGAITRDVAKQSADNSLQLMELTSMDPSIKAQAAATGINAAKTLLSKKAKQVKVMIKAGYKVLLKDKNIQQ